MELPTQLFARHTPVTTACRTALPYSALPTRPEQLSHPAAPVTPASAAPSPRAPTLPTSSLASAKRSRVLSIPPAPPSHLAVSATPVSPEPSTPPPRVRTFCLASVLQLTARLIRQAFPFHPAVHVMRASVERSQPPQRRRIFSLERAMQSTVPSTRQAPTSLLQTVPAIQALVGRSPPHRRHRSFMGAVKQSVAHLIPQGPVCLSVTVCAMRVSAGRSPPPRRPRSSLEAATLSVALSTPQAPTCLPVTAYATRALVGPSQPDLPPGTMTASSRAAASQPAVRPTRQAAALALVARAMLDSVGRSPPTVLRRITPEAVLQRVARRIPQAPTCRLDACATMASLASSLPRNRVRSTTVPASSALLVGQTRTILRQHRVFSVERATSRVQVRQRALLAHREPWMLILTRQRPVLTAPAGTTQLKARQSVCTAQPGTTMTTMIHPLRVTVKVEGAQPEHMQKGDQQYVRRVQLGRQISTMIRPLHAKAAELARTLPEGSHHAPRVGVEPPMRTLTPRRSAAFVGLGRSVKQSRPRA